MYKTKQLDQVGALRPLDMLVKYNHPLPQVVQQALNNSLVLVVAVKQRMKVRRLYGTVALVQHERVVLRS